MNRRGLLCLSPHAALALYSIETRASRTPRSANAGYLVRRVARSQLRSYGHDIGQKPGQIVAQIAGQTLKQHAIVTVEADHSDVP